MRENVVRLTATDVFSFQHNLNRSIQAEELVRERDIIINQ